jgi:DNA-binding response OmpR family regulator
MTAVLIVEDEQHLADGLRFNLEAEGYRVEVAGDGETALELLTTGRARYDAVVLDVMLPGKDGFAVVAELRQAGQFVPVLMLTARGRPEDVLRGFEAGADDYLPKPFELAILIARLRGLLRRYEWIHRDRAQAPISGGETGERGRQSAAASATARKPEERVFAFNGKTIDFGALELHIGERTVRLTLMEAELLRHLIKHAGQAVSRKSMLEEVWGLREDTDTRAIDNFIVRLRRYIEQEPSKPRHLLTVRGVGYRFVAEPEKIE